MGFKKIGLAGVVCSLLAGCHPNEPLSLKIAHVNDTHSHFDEEVMPLGLPGADGFPALTYAQVGGFPRLKTKIDLLRVDASLQEKDFMLLHAGDAFSGTLFFSLFKRQLNADFMNLFGFDAMAIGNHEFDLGNDALAEFSTSVDFPLVSANVKVSKGDPMEDAFLPLTIKMFENQPVAIVGLTTEYTELISSPSDGTAFLDAKKAAKKVINALRGYGVNKVVFLTHLGLEEDRLLAQSVPGIDVIIGGHSPELLGDHSNIGLSNELPSPIMEVGPKGDPVCIMHSGEYSKTIGVTDIEFSADGVVESCNGQNIFLVGDVFFQGNPPQPVSVDTQQVISDYILANANIEIVEKDVYSQAILDQAKFEVAAFAAKVIGAAGEPLYHVRLPGDQHPDGDILDSGSDVAPHVALSMATKMEQTSGQPYVSIMNAGGVRADLVGEISVGSSYSALPFSSTLVSMTVTGQSLFDTLSANVSNAYQVSGVVFPYVANIRYTINVADPFSPQVENVQVKGIDGLYQPLSLSDRYNMATTSYLAGGGDFYRFDGAEEITDTGHVDAEVFSQYVERQPGGVLNKLPAEITIQ
jgi:5'-nucleotidase